MNTIKTNQWSISKPFIALITMLFFLSSPYVGAEENWKKKKDKHGIKVYLTKSPLSKFKKFKGDAVIDAPIETFIELLEDPSTYTEWMDGVLVSESVKKIDNNKSFTYVVQAVPLLKDRHSVLEVDKVQEGDSVTYFVEYTDEAKKMMPDTNKYVDIDLMQGFYRFTKINDNQTKVELGAVADPAGRIPATAANFFVVKVPYNTLRNLQKITAKGK